MNFKIEQIIESIEKHRVFAFALLFLAIIRFTANIPVLFLADSQKYISPPVVIQNQDLNAIWISINFSLFERVLNYFIQLACNDDLSLSIILNKVFALFSTFLIYLIIFEITASKKTSLIAALVFSLSPAMMYMENAIMAEAFFIFFILLFTYLFKKILEAENSKVVILLAIVTGLVMGFAELTKQTADTWALLILTVTLAIGLFQYYKSKKIKFIVVSVLIYGFSFLPKIPVYLENAKMFGRMDLTLTRTVDSGAGVLLWSLTEDMVYSNPATSNPWLTNVLVNLTEQYKRQFLTNDKNSNTRPFMIAVSRLSMAGRQGELIHPYTQQKITTAEWSKICKQYWREVSFSQPKLLLERIFKTSFVNMFLKEDLGLFIWENSLRPGVGFQPIQFCKFPFSFVKNIDPVIEATRLQPIKLEVNPNQVTKVKDFYSYYKYIADENHYYVMVNMDTPYGFSMPINSFSIWWQKIWAWMPWIYFIAPIFLIALGVYFWIRSYALFDIFILCSVLYFSLLPLLVSLAEARYRLQFVPFMIIFIAITWGKYLNYSKVTKTENK